MHVRLGNVAIRETQMKMRKTLVAIAVLSTLGAACGKGREGAGRGRSGGDEGGTTGGPAVAGSCLERYSPEKLAQRDYAFDGVVSFIEETKTTEGEEETTGAEITFKVNRSYKGEARDEVTLKSSIAPGAVTSVDFPSLKEGKRYLVSGDGDFIGVCGFTQEYSDAEAKVWADALK